MKTNLKELRYFFSHNKPIYKNLSHFSEICFYLRDIGKYRSSIFPEISAFSCHLTNSDLRLEKRLSDPSFEDLETDL